MPPGRLERHPLTTVDRGRPVSLRFEGRPVPGFDQEPVALALWAAGRRVLSRSMRYHRARGYFCGAGACTHCFLQLDGVPNERSCLTPCRDGQWIEGQNAYPSIDHDVFAVNDVLFPGYLDAHRSFIRPAFLRPIYERVIRGMAGFGRVPQRPVAQTYHEEEVTCDVCVVGAGAAGLAAADAASATGAKVTLLEARPLAGGRLRFLPTPFHATAADAPRAEGKAYAEERLARLRARSVDVRTGTRLFGVYDGGVYAAASSTRFLRVRARALVLAPGAHDEYRPFPGADRAGVLLTGGAQRMLNQYGVPPGDDVVLVGATRDNLLLARDLLACGLRVAAIVDPRLPLGEDPLGADLRRMGVPIQWSTRPVKVVGRRGVQGLDVERGTRRRIDCDAIVLGGRRVPAVELFQQARCGLRYDARCGFVPAVDADGATSMANVFGAGAAVGTQDAWQSVRSGERAGEAAARLVKVNA